MKPSTTLIAPISDRWQGCRWDGYWMYQQNQSR